jgi:hypothetical protein
MYFSFSPKLAGKSYLKLPDSNIIERRYHMSEENAANTSSYLLVGSIFLYPLVRLRIIFVIACGFIIPTVWLHRGPPEASSNSNPTFFPIVNINHGGLLLVCLATGLDKDTFARYFFVRYGSWLLSLSVLRFNTISFSLTDSMQYYWL